MSSDATSKGYALSWTEVCGLMGVMLIASLIVFGASIGYGFLSFDDSYLIANNLAARGPTLSHIIQAFTTFDPELYIPFTLLSYQFDYLLGGLHGGIFHTTNIVIHALNGALVSYLIFLLLGRKKLALACGILFVVHPVNTEAVAWLSGRKDLLSTMFYLATMCLYLRFLYAKSKAFWWAAIAMFVCALLSKVSVLTLPVSILLLEALMRERREWSTSVLLRVTPFLALSAVFAGIATLGKERVLSSSTLTETALMAMKSTLFYLQKFAVPIDLSPIYPYMKPIVITSPDFFVPAIIVGALLILVLASLRWTKWIFICFALFFVTLSPSFLNFHKGTTIFFAVDRYAYLPLVWIILLLAVGIAEATDRIRRRMYRQVIAGTVGIVIAVLAVLSFEQTKLWIDDETLFTHVLTLYPMSVSARTSLAAVYRTQGRQLDEVNVLQEGLALHRDVAYYTGIGSVAAAQGKFDQAETLYNQARILDPENPEPFFFLGALEEMRGNTEEAIDDYRQAILLDPSYVAAYNNLGAIELDRRNLPEAESAFRKALEWNPNFMEGYYNLFQSLELQKKREEAFPYLEKAYELNPENADITISIAYRYFERGRKSEAVSALTHLLTLEPANVSAKRLLDLIEPQKEASPTPPSAEERRLERLKERALE